MIARAALLSALTCVAACTDSKPTTIQPLAGSATVQSPSAKAAITPQLARDQLVAKAMTDACNDSVSGIGTVQRDHQLPIKFSTKRVRLLLKTVPRNRARMLELAALLGVKLANATDNGEPECIVHGDAPPKRPDPPDRLKRLLVDVPSISTSNDTQLLKSDDGNSTFCGVPAKQTMDFIDDFPARLVRLAAQQPGGLPPELLGATVTPDYLTVGYQILDNTETSDKGSPLEDGATDYWRLMDLFRAWQLSQFATPPARTVIRTAIVDIGFNAQKDNITWSQHDDTDPNDQAFGTKGADDQPWHGSNCGSALNASVTPGSGASGSALLGADSHFASISQKRPKVLTIAAQPPDALLASMTQFIECSIWKGGADIVSVSRGVDCVTQKNCLADDTALASVLSYANDNSVAVFFAAGQSNELLVPNDQSDDPHYQWGCQTEGALCVGGVDSFGAVAAIGNSASNYGPSVGLWGPGRGVTINGDPGGTDAVQAISGTSLSTPFIAGMVALAESTWGKTYGNSQLQKSLDAAGVPSAISKRVPKILQGYLLMQTSPDGVPVPIAADGRETGAGNDSTASADAGAEPTSDELLTLHKASDVDFLKIDQKTSGPRKIQIKFLNDLQAVLVDKEENRIDSTDAGTDGNKLPTCGTKTLVFDNLPANTYFLKVLPAGKQTTGYTVDANYVTPALAVKH